MIKKESKKLIYKHAAGTGGETLQDLLTNALNKYKKPKARVEEMGADGSEVRFIAYGRKNGQALIGVFHKLTKGRAQEVIDMVDDKDEWSVSALSAKLAGKEASEFIEGTLFFQVWKNHLVIHQTASCRADHFQDYLSWLLSRVEEAAAKGKVSQAIMVELNDPMSPSVRKKSKTPVTKIVVGAPLGGQSLVPVSGNQSVTKQHKRSFKMTGKIWEAINLIFGELDAKVPRDLSFDEAMSDGDLRASLELSCTKKKAGASAGAVLDSLRRSLSHSPAKYTVHLADGSQIKGDEMKVRSDFRVECSHHHPVHESMFRCMMDYMMALIEDETIIEDEPFGNAK